MKHVMLIILVGLLGLAGCESNHVGLDEPLDGDTMDGDVLDGDITERDAFEDDTIDMDLLDGDVVDVDLELPDGDMTDGDMTDGDMTDGDMIDGDMTDGDMTDGDMDNDMIDGDAEEEMIEGDVENEAEMECPAANTADRYEPNETCADPTVLAGVVSNETGLSISSGIDQDYFSFEVPTDERCQVDITIDFMDDCGNLDMELRDDNLLCSVLDTAYSLTDGESISHMMDAGVYNLRVFGALLDTNAYDLTIDIHSCEPLAAGPEVDIQWVCFNKDAVPPVPVDGDVDAEMETELDVESEVQPECVQAPELDTLNVHQRVVWLWGTVADMTVESGILSVDGVPVNIDINNGTFGEMHAAPAVLGSRNNTVRVSAENASGVGWDTVQIFSDVPPADIAVIMSWETNVNDLDLYVTEPEDPVNGNVRDTCYWDDKLTTLGGIMNVDDTDGYGPENYWISKGDGDMIPTGIWEVNIHHFALNGLVTLEPIPFRVDVFLNENSLENETRQTVFGTISFNADSTASTPANIRSNVSWAGYDSGHTAHPNPSDGSAAFGVPVMMIENLGTSVEPNLQIIYP